MEQDMFKNDDTVCVLDIYKMKSKEGKLFFTNDKLCGKSFPSKHIVQVSLELSSQSASVPSQEKPSHNIEPVEPCLNIASVNQLVNTILESETLPRKVTKSKLKGILKNVSWWKSVYPCAGRTYIQLEAKKLKKKVKAKPKK